MILSGNYDIFVDVGAYIGYFSMIASHYCKKVIAYEASPIHYGILLYNTRFLKNVECKYFFISNTNNTPRIYNLNKKRSGCSHMVNMRQEDAYNIPVKTLDEELLAFNDQRMLIKIDIEGYELEALKGASELIKCSNIHWQIDEHAPIKLEDVLSFFPNREITGSIVGGLKK